MNSAEWILYVLVALAATGALVLFRQRRGLVALVRGRGWDLAPGRSPSPPGPATAEAIPTLAAPEAPGDGPAREQSFRKRIRGTWYDLPFVAFEWSSWTPAGGAREVRSMAVLVNDPARFPTLEVTRHLALANAIGSLTGALGSRPSLKPVALPDALANWRIRGGPSAAAFLDGNPPESLARALDTVELTAHHAVGASGSLVYATTYGSMSADLLLRLLDQAGRWRTALEEIAQEE